MLPLDVDRGMWDKWEIKGEGKANFSLLDPGHCEDIGALHSE